MNQKQDFELERQSELQAISDTVRALATKCEGDSLALLALLRTLERLHREIQEGVFQVSLPDNRQALYALLKDIEEEGGWPYIDRMRLRSLLKNFSQLDLPVTNPEPKAES
ncbi:MAG: hypothetical protein WBB28_20410 [Crinalium sp.]